MKINIKATSIELTAAIADYVNKKVSALDKFAPSDAVAQVEVGRSTQHHKQGDVFRAEIHLIGAGLDVYASSEQADLYAAIDLVKDELREKLMHTKGKKEALYRRGARRMKDMMRGFNPFKNRE